LFFSCSSPLFRDPNKALNKTFLIANLRYKHEPHTYTHMHVTVVDMAKTFTALLNRNIY